jgi:predicted secreted protein
MSHHSFQGKLRWMVGLLVIGLVASACTSALAKTAELSAGCDQFSSLKSVGQQADLAVGDLLKVTLCSNPTTGFSWQEPAISDAAVISLVDKTFGAATASGTAPVVGAATASGTAPVVGAATASGTAPVVGAAGTDSITLEATAKGTSNVVLKYSQPWLGGTSSEWMYTLTVTVR